VGLGPHHAQVKQLQPGGYFGEVTLMNENTAPPTATVVALTETHTLSLGGEEFRRLLGDMGVQVRLYSARTQLRAGLRAGLPSTYPLRHLATTRSMLAASHPS
jgi:CRP-like cAMP-binding protein